MPTLNFGSEDNLKRVIFYQYNAALISRAVPKFDNLILTTALPTYSEKGFILLFLNASKLF